MALPPTVPTSFVPKQPVRTTRRSQSSGGGGLFVTLALIIAGGAILMAGGMFGYSFYLDSVRTQKAASLKQAEASISRETVDEFIRLRDRFTSTSNLLNQHVALSQFFTVLESITVANVGFESLSVNVLDDRTASITMTGTARNFNALAAESAAFAGEKRIRRAIFSGISTAENGGVTFSLEADLDPKLVLMVLPSSDALSQPAALSEPATTTPVATTTTP